MRMAIKFSELKKYISRVVRISVLFRDYYYENYTMISDIPEGKYDDLYVFGVGMCDVEFPLDVYSEPKEPPRRIPRKDGLRMGCALEILVQEEAREFARVNEETLTFGDLRNYLQCGKNFSIVTKEEWKEENYEWRHDIPEKYNDMYVYGIGIEDNPEGLLEASSIILDTLLVKKMRIVVSESPRD